MVALLIGGVKILSHFCSRSLSFGVEPPVLVNIPLSEVHGGHPSAVGLLQHQHGPRGRVNAAEGTSEASPALTRPLALLPGFIGLCPLSSNRMTFVLIEVDRHILLK